MSKRCCGSDCVNNSLVICVINEKTYNLLLGGVEGGVEEEDSGGARQAVRAVADGAAPAQAAAQRQRRQGPDYNLQN